MEAKLLYLWGRTGRGGGELVGGELVMGRNLLNSSRPGRRHCVVFLGKTLYPHSASPSIGRQDLDAMIIRNSFVQKCACNLH